jgi:hypothetical protein
MKQLIFLSIILLACLYSYSQNDSAYSQIDSAYLQNDSARTSLTVGIIYSNHASYYGQRAAEATPYVAGAASLRFPSGIYFSGMAYKLLRDSGSLVSAGSLGAGIELKLSKKLTADLSYSHTFYPANSPFLQAANNNTATAALSYAYWLTSALTVDYAFGKQQDIFGIFNTSKFISFGNLFSRNDGIAITPSIEIAAGTKRFYQTYLTEKRLRDSVLGLPLPPLLGSPSDEPTNTTTTSTQFDLLSYSFRLPLSYYRSRYLLEVAYQFSIPVDETTSGSGEYHSFFNLGFYYQF